MSKELGIIDLLRVCGFDPSCRSKIVRHQDKRYESHELFRRGWLDAYQSFQSKPVFDNLDYIISFIGSGGTQARLLGVYKVLGRRDGNTGKLPSGCPYLEWQSNPYFYELERQTEFEALEHRVVIEWGRAAQAWHQYTKNKAVTQILPKGTCSGCFPITSTSHLLTASCAIFLNIRRPIENGAPVYRRSLGCT